VAAGLPRSGSRGGRCSKEGEHRDPLRNYALDEHAGEGCVDRRSSQPEDQIRVGVAANLIDDVRDSLADLNASCHRCRRAVRAVVIPRDIDDPLGKAHSGEEFHSQASVVGAKKRRSFAIRFSMVVALDACTSSSKCCG